MTDIVEREEETTLEECPIGLFVAGGELCLKTEYGTNEGRIDAFIVSSGEFFWGAAPQTIASQRVQKVVPISIDLDELTRARSEIAAKDAEIARLREALDWIAAIADKEYEHDDKLRSQGARTLIRISDRARLALSPDKEGK